MIRALKRHHEQIVAALRRIERRGFDAGGGLNHWGTDFRGRLFAFAPRGKLIRGSLVAAGCEAFGGEATDAVYDAAAAIELVQSFLLIHDDVMDEDRFRRGIPSFVEQYREVGSADKVSRIDRFAESMAICAGDTTMSIAMEAFGTLDLPADLVRRIFVLVAREIALVAIAQMGDVANGHSSVQVSEDEILTLYRYKTGRYTFSLPLMIGAVIASTRDDILALVARWGELQGIVFQIRDDLLDIMEDPARTGKPAGSDVVANKQTLCRRVLLDRLPDTPDSAVAALFGKPDFGREDLQRVREAIIDSGTLDALEMRIRGLRAEAEEILGRMDGLTDAGRTMLATIDHYNAERIS